MKRMVLFFGFVVSLCAVASVFGADSVTFVTYYPSPYGIYRELKAKKMVVGDVSQAAPIEDGVLQVDRGVVFTPQAAAPTTNPQEGELVYVNDGSTKSFQFYDGTAWAQDMGSGTGGGSTYVAVATTSCVAGWTSAYTGQLIFPFHQLGGIGSPMCASNPSGWGWNHMGAGTTKWSRGSDDYLYVSISCALCVK